ncbi:unnamed protein product, partial [Vitis vinifera]|uniref:Uncharacterized protein n=1 Tax=Vitis vinifera TaxID=29760 RepID=D7T315_VITVI
MGIQKHLKNSLTFQVRYVPKDHLKDHQKRE